MYTSIRMAKAKLETIPNASKDAEKLDHSCLARKNTNGTATKNRNVAVAYKTNYTVIIQPSYVTQTSENMFSQNLYINIDSRFIHSIWKQLNILL